MMLIMKNNIMNSTGLEKYILWTDEVSLRPSLPITFVTLIHGQNYYYHHR